MPEGMIRVIKKSDSTHWNLCSNGLALYGFYWL